MPSSTLHPSDSDLIQRVREGESRAFDELVARHYGVVCAVALARLRNVETAEDLVQEVFLRNYLHLAALRDPTRYAHWAVRLARNLAVDWQRRGITRSRLLPMVPMEDVVVEPADESRPDALESLMERQQLQHMNDALWKLPEFTRELVLMHYHEGMSKKDIAERVGMNPANVGRHLDKALEAMLRDIEAQGTPSAPTPQAPKAHPTPLPLPGKPSTGSIRQDIDALRARQVRRAAAVVAATAALAPEAKAAIIAASASSSAGSGLGASATGATATAGILEA